jgi:hypothetical protein
MGKMTLHCDNKGALRNPFCPIKEGITPYLSTDHDLIELVQQLLSLIPITIATEWVKGHYTRRNREYKHNLNDTADRLAGDYQRLHTSHYTIPRPIAPPNFSIRLLWDNSVLLPNTIGEWGKTYTMHPSKNTSSGKLDGMLVNSTMYIGMPMKGTFTPYQDSPVAIPLNSSTA